MRPEVREFLSSRENVLTSNVLTNNVIAGKGERYFFHDLVSQEFQK